jgi:hypothetical protein
VMMLIGLNGLCMLGTGVCDSMSTDFISN